MTSPSIKREFAPLAFATLLVMNSMPAHAIPGSKQALQKSAAPLELVQLDAQFPPPGTNNLQPPAGMSATPPVHAAMDNGLRSLSKPTDPLVITFSDPLPANLKGEISIRKLSYDMSNNNQNELETIPFNSPKIKISADRLALTIEGIQSLLPGETYCTLFPETDFRSAKVTSPCCFKAPLPVEAVKPPEPAPQPPAPKPGFPRLLYVLIGGVVVGLIIYAATRGGGDSTTTTVSQ